MNGNVLDQNRVYLCGIITESPEFSHEMYGENFYEAILAVDRTSGNTDLIPLTISEKVMEEDVCYSGRPVEVWGSFRSSNHTRKGVSHTRLSVFVKELELVEGYTAFEQINEANLEGYICKKPDYRVTPKGREITGMLVAVNRLYGKSDYIPCIAWGRNAKYSARLKVGDKVRLHGRIQSRDYNKQYSDRSWELKTAYELSVSSLSVCAVENNTSMTKERRNDRVAEPFSPFGKHIG